MIAEDHPTAAAVRALVDKHCRDGQIQDVEEFKRALAKSVRGHIKHSVTDSVHNPETKDITLTLACDTSEAIEYLHYAKALVLRRIGH